MVAAGSESIDSPGDVNVGPLMSECSAATSSWRDLWRTATACRLEASAIPARILSALCRVAAERVGIDAETMRGNTKRRVVVSARALVCAIGVTHYRMPLGAIARHLRISPQSVLYGCSIADRVLARLGLTLADLLSDCSTIDDASHHEANPKI